MVLHITFQELSELAKTKADKIVELYHVDNKNVNVKYTHLQKVPLIDKHLHISVDATVRVDEFENGDLFITYDAGVGLDTIISGVLTLFPSLRDMNIVEILDGQKAVVHMTKVDNVRDALKKISIQDISFDQDGANVVLALK